MLTIVITFVTIKPLHQTKYTVKRRQYTIPRNTTGDISHGI